MEDRSWPAAERTDAAGRGPADDDRELENLLRTYPGLDGLEFFYIEWELVWPM
jgi:hypothetical protein